MPERRFPGPQYKSFKGIFMNLDLVKQLRDRTGVGMMDCKKALIETDGDLEKAIEILRKKGIAIAAKRSGNETNNGSIAGYVSEDYSSAGLVQVSCETDFSANTTDLKGFANNVAQIVSEEELFEDELLESKLASSDLTVKQALEDLIAKIAESIKVQKFTRMEAGSSELINAYIHADSSIGVLVKLAADGPIEGQNRTDLALVAKDICMHVAVMNPLGTNSDDLDQDVVNKERALISDQLKSSGKPEAMIEKIMEGKIRKYYEEVCLAEQKFIKNDKVSVGKHISDAGNAAGVSGLKIKQFVRFGIGR